MLKIFHLITSIQVGGAESIAIRLVENCALAYPGKFEFIILELHRSNNEYSHNKRNELERKGIKVITLGGNIKRTSLLIAPFNLLFRINKEKPAIIHSHTDLPDFVLATTLRLSFFSKPKIFRTIHNTQLWGTHPVFGRFTEAAFISDVIIGVSDSALQAYKDIRNRNRLPISDRLYRIFNGCEVPVKSEHPFEINPLTINIVFCGRLEYQKGIDVLLNCIKLFNRNSRDKITFHIIGDGSFKNAVIKLVEEEENAIYYDPVINLENKIHPFDYLVMPSRFEGLGLISVEASLSKVPVIASFAAGLSETLPEAWPLKFHLNNEGELLLIFDKIVKREYELKALKEEAYMFARNRFSLDKMVEEYSKIYLLYGLGC